MKRDTAHKIKDVIQKL